MEERMNEPFQEGRKKNASNAERGSSECELESCRKRSSCSPPVPAAEQKTRHQEGHCPGAKRKKEKDGRRKFVKTEGRTEGSFSGRKEGSLHRRKERSLKGRLSRRKFVRIEGRRKVCKEGRKKVCKEGRKDVCKDGRMEGREFVRQFVRKEGSL